MPSHAFLSHLYFLESVLKKRNKTEDHGKRQTQHRCCLAEQINQLVRTHYHIEARKPYDNGSECRSHPVCQSLKRNSAVVQEEENSLAVVSEESVHHRHYQNNRKHEKQICFYCFPALQQNGICPCKYGGHTQKHRVKRKHRDADCKCVKYYVYRRVTARKPAAFAQSVPEHIVSSFPLSA